VSAPRSFGRAAARAAGIAATAASALLLVYVAYAHWASARSRREAMDGAYDLRFDTAGPLGGRFAVERDDGVEARVEGGRLVFAGTARRAGAVARLVGPRQRLEDVRLRARVQIRSAGADVTVGIERDGGDEPRALSIALHGGAEPLRASIAGATSSIGRRDDVVPEGPRAAAPLEDGGGALLGAGAPAWHEVALRVSPELQSVLGLVDGAPVASAPSAWDDGAPVRLVVAVVAREASAPIDVALEEVAYETIPSEERATSFVDRFDGKVIDPRRWAVFQADPWLADAAVAIRPGGGLAIRGASLDRADFVAAASLVTPRVLLGSFALRMRARASSLTRSAIYVGLVSTPAAGLARRTLDVGVVDADGAAAPFVVGHWDDTGQARFVSSPSPPAPDAGAAPRERAWTIDLRYDAATRRAVAAVDGAEVLDRVIDLRPLDDVTFHLGANLQARGASIDAAVDEIRLDAITP